MSPYSGLTVMFGFSASNALIAVFVSSARAAFPHQAKRSSTFPLSGAVELLLEQAAVTATRATATSNASAVRVRWMVLHNIGHTGFQRSEKTLSLKRTKTGVRGQWANACQIPDAPAGPAARSPTLPQVP